MSRTRNLTAGLFVWFLKTLLETPGCYQKGGFLHSFTLVRANNIIEVFFNHPLNVVIRVRFVIPLHWMVYGCQIYIWNSLVLFIRLVRTSSFSTSHHQYLDRAALMSCLMEIMEFWHLRERHLLLSMESSSMKLRNFLWIHLCS